MWQPTEKQIDLAVSWWAKQLTECEFPFSQDFVEQFSLDVPRITVWQLGTFRRVLREELKNNFAAFKQYKDADYALLSSGYWPQEHMAIVAQIAEIPRIIFPQKRTMWLYVDGRVKACAGYDAEPVELT